MKKAIIAGLLGLVLMGTFGAMDINTAALDYTSYNSESIKKFAVTYLDGAEYVNPNYSENGFAYCRYFYSGEAMSSGISLDREGHRDLRRSEFCT